MASSLSDRLKQAIDAGSTYSAPAPNEDAHSVNQLMFGSTDYRPVIDEWSKNNRDAIAMAIRKRKYIDWRSELGLGPFDMAYIYTDPIAPVDPFDFGYNDLWNPDDFGSMLISDGAIMAKVMVSVRSGIDFGQILRLSDMISDVFRDRFIPLVERNAFEFRKTNVSTIKEEPLRLDRAISLFESKCKTIVAKFLLGLFFIDNDVWAENAIEIARHLPSDSYMNRPASSSESALDIGNLELTDDPDGEAERLIEAMNKRSSRASGKSIGGLEDIGDLL